MCQLLLELPDTDAGTQTLILCKISKCSEPLSLLLFMSYVYDRVWACVWPSEDNLHHVVSGFQGLN